MYLENIDVEQINLNNFYNQENNNIPECTYIITDPKNNIIKKGIKIHDIYLPKIKKMCYDDSSELYKDLVMFKAESYEEMALMAKGNKEREMIMEDLKRLGSNPEFTDYYDHEEFQEILKMSEIEEAHNEGLAEGHTSGLKEGKKEIINKLYKSGMSEDTLSNILEIPSEEISKYLN